MRNKCIVNQLSRSLQHTVPLSWFQPHLRVCFPATCDLFLGRTDNLRGLHRRWLWSLGLAPLLTFNSGAQGPQTAPVAPVGHPVFGSTYQPHLGASSNAADSSSRQLAGCARLPARSSGRSWRRGSGWQSSAPDDGGATARSLHPVRRKTKRCSGQTATTKSSLKISVGGSQAAAVALNEGWQRRQRFADSLHAGENTLSLTFAQGGNCSLGGAGLRFRGERRSVDSGRRSAPTGL